MARDDSHAPNNALTSADSQSNAVGHRGYDLFSEYRGLLMGVQIVLIMFFHIAETCHSYDVRYSGFIRLFHTYIGSSGVDIFLLLSGLGLYFSWKRNPDSKKFYRKRFSRLLVPYFLIAIPAWIIRYCVTDRGGVKNYFADLFYISFFTRGERWIWYIFMAAVCYLIFPYIFTVVETAHNRVDEILRIAVLILITTQFLLLLKLYLPDLYSNISIMISRFPAFFIGVLLGKWSYQHRKFSTRGVCVLFAVALIANCLLGMATTTILGVYSKALFNFAMCFVALILLDTMRCSRNSICSTATSGINRFFSWLGKYTLELYMSHVVIRRFLDIAGFPVYRISSICIMIAGSLVLSLILSRISNVIIRRITGTAKS